MLRRSPPFSLSTERLFCHNSAMNRLSRKMSRELDMWVSEGLVSTEQAAGIRAWYQKKRSGPGWGVILFSSLGSVIIGLGVILLFAYNWQAIPRMLKLGLVYGTLAATHGTAFWMFIRKENLRPLGEALSILATMLFGAGIWLIAQIYHIDEHFPNAFLIWGGGALILAWTMPSIAQGILACLLVTVWCGMEAVAFNRPMHAGPGIIMILVGLLAWRQRSRLLLGAALPTFLVSLVFVMITGHGDTSELTVTTLLNAGVFLVAAAVLTDRGRSIPQFAPILSFHGWLISLAVLYALTFPDAAEDILELNFENASKTGLFYWGATLALAAVAWGRIAFEHATRKSSAGVSWEYYLLPVTMLVATINLAVFRGIAEDWLAALPFNLVFMAIIAGMMMRGCRRSLARPTIVGAVLLLVFAFSRYVDLFESLLARGVVFIVVGAAIFAQGVVYNRIRKNKEAETET